MKLYPAKIDEAILALARERKHLTAMHPVEAGITTHAVVARRSLRRMSERGLMKRSEARLLCGNQHRVVSIYTLVSSKTAATPASQMDERLIAALRARGVASTSELVADTGIALHALWGRLKRFRRNGIISGKRDGLQSLHWLVKGA